MAVTLKTYQHPNLVSTIRVGACACTFPCNSHLPSCCAAYPTTGACKPPQQPLPPPCAMHLCTWAHATWATWAGFFV